MSRLSLTLLTVAAFVSLYGFSCGSGGGSGSDAIKATPDANEGKTFKAEVSVALGGSVSTATNTAKVEVPAGALDEDVEISIAVLPSEAGTETSIYEFGPAGTQFAKPVTISIKYDGTPGSNQKAVMAWKNGAKWQEIPGSKVQGGVVVAQIDHFTKFTIILVDDKVILTSECSDLVKKFKGCGGDPKGNWKIKDVCVADTVVGYNPYEEVCQGASMEVDMNWEGEMLIGATTITTKFSSMSFSQTIKIPMGCEILQHQECSNFMGEHGNCRVQGAFCVCTFSDGDFDDEEEEDVDVVNYVVQGNFLKVTDKDGDVSMVEYCVQGNMLTFKMMDEEDDEYEDEPSMEAIVVLQRK